MTGWTRTDFINFLEDTLIPDLMDSGSDSTASDFIRAVAFMKDPRLERIDDWTIDMLSSNYRR